MQRPWDQESLRRGAVAVSSLAVAAPTLYPEPYLVWATDLPTEITPANDRRSVTLFLHNAGGAPCRVLEITSSAPWLVPDWTQRELPPDGQAIALTLHVQATQFKAGEHPVTVTVSAAGAKSGQRYSLTHTLTAIIPDAPMPWFGAESLSFRGAYEPVSVSIRAEQPTRLTYQKHLVAQVTPGEELSLYPGEYRLGERALIVRGPRQTIILRNTGPRAFAARLGADVPWLSVSPETVEMLPGSETQLDIETTDDGRFWDDLDAAVLVRSSFDDTVLAHLQVERSWTLPGPRPALAEQAQSLELPAVQPGQISKSTLRLANIGDSPLTVRLRSAREGLRIHPGEDGALPVEVDSAQFFHKNRLEGAISLVTNARLPAWQYLSVPYKLSVVGVTLETTSVEFGPVRYREDKPFRIRVRRSDHKRSRLRLDIPTDLADVLTLTGDVLHLRNLIRRPLQIDGSYDLYDEELGDAPIGSIQIRGQCLVPKMRVAVPTLKLVPGEKAKIDVTVVDLGGGLELDRVTADQPWCRVKQSGLDVTLNVVTSPTDRGALIATLQFPSNDFTHPLQVHQLRVQMTPTLKMRISDLFWLIAAPVWRPLRRWLAPVWGPLRKRLGRRRR